MMCTFVVSCFVILVYMYTYSLFGPQGKAQRRINAVHVMDALVLNGTDVREQHFNQRYDSVTAINDS